MQNLQGNRKLNFYALPGWRISPIAQNLVAAKISSTYREIENLILMPTQGWDRFCTSNLFLIIFRGLSWCGNCQHLQGKRAKAWYIGLGTNSHNENFLKYDESLIPMLTHSLHANTVCHESFYRLPTTQPLDTFRCNHQNAPDVSLIFHPFEGMISLRNFLIPHVFRWITFVIISCNGLVVILLHLMPREWIRLGWLSLACAASSKKPWQSKKSYVSLPYSRVFVSAFCMTPS